MKPTEQHVADQARENLVVGVGRIASGWGYNKALGHLYALLYLTEKPLSLEDISRELGVTKGNVSVNIREAEHLGLVNKVWVKGDRRDYYEADPRLWKVLRKVARARQKKEFEMAMETINGSLEALDSQDKAVPGHKFAKKRLEKMGSFFRSFNTIMNGLLALETLRGAAVQACPVRSRIPRITGEDW